MCRKLGVTVLVVVAAMFVLHKLDLLGYIKTYIAQAREKVNDSISPETKLARIKGQIKELDGVINQQKSAVCKEKARVEKLNEEIDTAKANLKKTEAELARRREMLKNAKSDFVVIGKEKVAKSDFEASFARLYAEFEADEAALKAKEDLRATRYDRVEQMRQSLATMISKQSQMASRVEKLQLEWDKVCEQKMKNDLPDSDNVVADISKRLDDVEIQIGTGRNMVAMKMADDKSARIDKLLKQEQDSKDALTKWDARTEVKPEDKVATTKE
jgi:chromosome segregation ATPase